MVVNGGGGGGVSGVVCVLNIGYFVFGCFEHSVVGVFWTSCFLRNSALEGMLFVMARPLTVLFVAAVVTPLLLRCYFLLSGAYSNVDRTLHTGGSFTQHVYYAVAASNVWDPTYVYDCPAGYHWASTDEALQWVGSSGQGTSGGTTTTPRQPSYYDQCGWEGYMFGGKKRVKFRFSDSPTTGAYKSAGTYEDGDIVVGDFTTKEFAGTVCVKAADDGDVVRRRRTWR